MQVRTLLTTLIAALAVGLAALAFAPGSAAAQAGPPPSVRLDVHGDFGWYNTAGAGLRVDIPIVREGFIHGSRVHDDLSISPGLDMFWWYGYTSGGAGFIPMVMAQWNLYFAPQWSFLAELGLAVIYGPRNWNKRYYGSYLAPTGQLGFRWHFSSAAALLVRVGWPAGAQVGIAFSL